MDGQIRHAAHKFQSTSPTGEDTVPLFLEASASFHFNPLPPQGKTPGLGYKEVIDWIFQSTSPTGEDTFLPASMMLYATHFNPLPPQGKTPFGAM